MVPKSGTMPMYQKTTEIVAYVETAKTSHISGERNCGHKFMVKGRGSIQ
jgi:DNA-directed RNA polymerase subunit RPC12/RpoP